ncbi:hypothetical protein J2S19_003224 [Metabacillus malikii]|uniref:Uncharacterized protein n=2 Tax=Metabacillus malikii TaxID=1504265 RepID=A0ABT9ZI38_9BACI|nr:hypothetical protein [Metabacillus malikii]
MTDKKKMEKDNPTLEQNKKEPKMSQMGKVVTTGLFGGIFWSLLAYLASILNFMEISPKLILQPIALGEWKNNTLGEFIGIILIGILSIGVALVYYAILKRFKSMWVGIAYGAILWGLVFFILNPLFPDIKEIFELSRKTIVTSICLYVLYGLFVGYSISFDYNELTLAEEN